MNSLRPLLIVQMIVISIFIVLKQFRVDLVQAFPNPVFEIFLYSFPNFAEGVVGVLMLAGLLTMAVWNVAVVERVLTFPRLCACALLGGGTYVILQELGFHELGGAQVYDPYDVAFSIAGLLAGLGVFVWVRPARPTP